jgi:hypothetical protein
VGGGRAGVWSEINTSGWYWCEVLEGLRGVCGRERGKCLPILPLRLESGVSERTHWGADWWAGVGAAGGVLGGGGWWWMVGGGCGAGGVGRGVWGGGVAER